MKNIVVDINIFMDFLFKREGHEKVAEIFRYCTKNRLKGYVCAHEITTLSYFLRKSITEKEQIRKSLSWIMGCFEVIEVNAMILGKSLHSEIDDYEDAVIEVSAHEKNADCILTRDINDFKKSKIKVTTPEELLAIINQNGE